MGTDPGTKIPLPTIYSEGVFNLSSNSTPSLIYGLSAEDFAPLAKAPESASDPSTRLTSGYPEQSLLKRKGDLQPATEQSSNSSRNSTQTKISDYYSNKITTAQSSNETDIQTGPQSRDINGPLGKSYPKSGLPKDPAARKKIPLWSGLVKYFPDALAAVASVSQAGSEQHHPGQPLHWDRAKSTDQEDTLLRHLWESGTLDTDGHRHSAKVAWRALAMLQLEIENAK